MAPINYRYFVRGTWAGRADEKPAVTGAKFLKTLDCVERHRSAFFKLGGQQKLEDR